MKVSLRKSFVGLVQQCIAVLRKSHLCTRLRKSHGNGAMADKESIASPDSILDKFKSDIELAKDDDDADKFAIPVGSDSDDVVLADHCLILLLPKPLGNHNRRNTRKRSNGRQIYPSYRHHDPYVCGWTSFRPGHQSDIALLHLI